MLLIWLKCWSTTVGVEVIANTIVGSQYLNIFLLGFSHIKYEYIIENWVWLRWLGLELGLQNAAGPFISSLELVLLCQPSSCMAALVRPQKFFFQLGWGLNTNQSGIPADSKGVACWYFNTNWCWSFNTNSPMPRLWYCKKRQKRLTLRARLRYLENSDQCIKFTGCSSLYALSWSKNWGSIP